MKWPLQTTAESLRDENVALQLTHINARNPLPALRRQHELEGGANIYIQCCP